jgi:hypothetical protein
MRPLPIEPFGGAPEFVVGVSRIRGAHVPVVDLGQVLGRSEPSLATRFVLLRCESRTVALQVEGVLGVATFSPAEARDLPPLLDDAAGGPIAALGERDGRAAFAAARDAPRPGSARAGFRIRGIRVSAALAADVEHFRGLVAGRLGLWFDDDKLAWLREVLVRRLDKLRTPVADYLSRPE